ncbi:hypothetical protein QCA50_004028 [Cerrena zonata]|uniref:Uncharacterized protein n=1 Tax=Cerrena zonata TaxID=2478898 RepID=A0AAW0GQ97_9APHY
MSTKTITFTSSHLGENVNLVLCFARPTDYYGDLVKPLSIAWKTASLSAHGESSATVAFTNSPAFCTTEVNDRFFTTPHNYVPISGGQETTLLANHSVKPPTQEFTDPLSVGDTRILRATNDTGRSVHFGLGFISNADQPNESFTLTSIFQNAHHGASVKTNFPTILRAYAGIDYQEGQIIDKEPDAARLIWEGDVLELHSITNIVINKTKSMVTNLWSATETVVEVPTPRPLVIEMEKVYTATLCFGHSEVVVANMKTIAEYLINKSYKVKVTYVEGSCSASMDITLPHGSSCDTTERDMLGVIDTHLHNADRARLKCRSGSRMVSSGDHFSYWVDINPASSEWYTTHRHSTVYTHRLRQSQSTSNLNRLANGNHSSHNLTVTKNRSVSRASFTGVNVGL